MLSGYWFKIGEPKQPSDGPKTNSYPAGLGKGVPDVEVVVAELDPGIAVDTALDPGVETADPESTEEGSVGTELGKLESGKLAIGELDPGRDERIEDKGIDGGEPETGTLETRTAMLGGVKLDPGREGGDDTPINEDTGGVAGELEAGKLDTITVEGDDVLPG